jgi:FkbM family methyltransferase
MENGLFVDVGANIGQTLLDLQLVHPSVPYLGFEPNLVCAAYLRELIAVNQFKNCAILPLGLASEAKVSALFLQPGDDTDSCATLVSDLRPARQLAATYVPVFPMSAVSNSLDLSSISFIKIDVEGAEDEVLFGMRAEIKAFRPAILCEVLFTDSEADLHSAKVKNDAIMAFLNEIDYGVFQLIKSQNDQRVVNLLKISEFENVFWTLENKDLCDYLFVPAEQESRIGNMFLT